MLYAGVDVLVAVALGYFAICYSLSLLELRHTL
jgi:hypothetical protein